MSMYPGTLILLALLMAGCTSSIDEAEPLRLTVMTFNMWGAGGNEGKPIDDTVAVIRAVNPDIVGLQETRAEAAVCDGDDCPPSGISVAASIAQALGYHVYEQTRQNDALWSNAILSKYAISGTTANDLGAIFEIGERRVALFNVHLTDYPYQPYQLLGIPYSDAPFFDSESAAIEAATAARGSAITLLLAEIESTENLDVAFVTGDFNEPSHRDWTERAMSLGRHPISVRFPGAMRLENVGFMDTYRTYFADEIARPGFTWTPTAAVDDPEDHPDRIDYILLRADNVQIESAAVVGEKESAADIVVTPWPSDHRSVVTTVVLQ